MPANDAATRSILAQLTAINGKIAAEVEYLFTEPSAPRDEYKALCAERARIEAFARTKGIG